MRYLLLVLALFITACGCGPTIMEQARLIPYAQSGYIPTGAPEEQTNEIRLRGLAALVQQVLGVKVIFSDEEEFRGGGSYSPAERLIVIGRTGFTAGQQFELLAHEAAHVLQPMGLREVEYQAWADLVGVAVCEQWGLNSRGASVRYLAGLKGGLHVVDDYRVDLNWAISVLSGRPVKVY